MVFRCGADPVNSQEADRLATGAGRAGQRRAEVGRSQPPDVDHTPSQSAGDDRPLRILERAPVPAEHKERLFDLVRHAQALGAAAGEELQAEFGPEHVALIVGHNQFLRLFRGGAQPGVVEMLLPDEAKAALQAAGFTLREPGGQVFKLFGWVRIDPMQGAATALDAAVDAAFAKARAPAPVKKR